MNKHSSVDSNEGKNDDSSFVGIHTTRSTKYWSLSNLKNYFPRYTLKQQGNKTKYKYMAHNKN